MIRSVRLGFGYLMKDQSESPDVALLRRAYEAFDRRDFEAVLAMMHADVDWPNAWEGGRVHGRDSVRDYWKRQFAVLDSRLDAQDFKVEQDGRVAVEVRQVVHDKNGKLVADRVVEHVYEIRDGLIRNMEVRD